MRLSLLTFILVVVLGIGFFLRLYNLDKESLWRDEGGSVTAANLKPTKIIKHMMVTKDKHPPLYYLLLHYWIRLFGISEFSIRFLSLIFGILTIFMLYKVADLLFDKGTGILSALLLTLSVFHIKYSQEARMYTMLSFFSALSIYFFIKLLRNKKPANLICYILTTIILMYTHYYGFFIIAAQNIYIITLPILTKQASKLKLKNWIFLQIILLVLFMPQIKMLINQSYQAYGEFWVPIPSLSSIKNLFLQYSDSKSKLLLFLSIFTISAITYLKINNKNKVCNFFSIEATKIYLLSLWLLVPIITPLLISLVFKPIFWARYTIGASLVFYLLLGKGIRNINLKYLKLFIICTLIIISARNIQSYYNQVKNEQWRDVAAYIDNQAKIGDIIISPSGNGKFCFNYYSKRTDLIQNFLLDRSKEKLTLEFKLAVHKSRRAWLIILADKKLERRIFFKYYKEIFKENYNLLDYKEYIRINLYLFEQKLW